MPFICGLQPRWKWGCPGAHCRNWSRSTDDQLSPFAHCTFAEDCKHCSFLAKKILDPLSLSLSMHMSISYPDFFHRRDQRSCDAVFCHPLALCAEASKEIFLARRRNNRWGVSWWAIRETYPSNFEDGETVSWFYCLLFEFNKKNWRFFLIGGRG